MNKFLIIAAFAAVALGAFGVELSDDEYRDFKFFQELQWKQRAKDEKTVAGATKWHGEVTSTVVDEERLVEVTTFEDGWTFERKYSPKRPGAKSPAEIAAERKRRVAELAKRIPLEAAENIVARDDPPKTNVVDAVVRPEVKEGGLK